MFLCQLVFWTRSRTVANRRSAITLCVVLKKMHSVFHDEQLEINKKQTNSSERLRKPMTVPSAFRKGEYEKVW